MNPTSEIKALNIQEISSDDEPPAPNARLLQGPFDHDQKAFLMSFLERYLAQENGTKGSKKAWVKSNVYYAYIKKYQSDGEHGVNLSSLLTVCCGCFLFLIF
jgi:hypothetical protein